MITQTQLDNLKKNYYSGVLKFREGDTWVEYQNSKEMRIAIKDAEQELKNTAPSGTRLVTVNKGY